MAATNEKPLRREYRRVTGTTGADDEIAQTLDVAGGDPRVGIAG